MSPKHFIKNWYNISLHHFVELKPILKIPLI